MNEKEMKQKRPIFSIIIPMKNADRYIRRALDSIAIQQFEDIQVIVIQTVMIFQNILFSLGKIITQILICNYFKQ